MGGDHQQIPGGKGSNQAIAAARLGRQTSFVGCVGDDGPGEVLSGALRSAGVNLDGLMVTPDRPSGLALIAVDASGDNSIVVSPGANEALPASFVTSNAAVANASMLLLQLETPMDTVVAAAQAASGTVLLNPAPAATLPSELLARVDVLIPNETELAALVDQLSADDLDDLDAVAEAAKTLGPDVVVTLGARGALVVANRDGHTVTHVPAPTITPVDTTAAGDSFCAALADGLLRGDLVSAAQWAVQVGAATALAAGASSSLPTTDEVAARLGS